MSKFRNSYHDECIFDVFESKYEIREGKPEGAGEHRSKYLENISNNWNKGKLPRHTMGVAKYTSDPQSFLRRGGGFTKARPAVSHVCQVVKLPPIPRSRGGRRDGEAAVQGSGEDEEDDDGEGDGEGGKSCKCSCHRLEENKENIQKLENQGKAKSGTKYPEPRIVDDRFGCKQNLLGTFPKYIYSSSYGKVPRYIQEVSQQKAREAKAEADAAACHRSKCQYLLKNERDELLQGLKDNWETLNNTYLKLPVASCSPGIERQKRRFDVDLKALEDDILLVETHPCIYIHSDRKDG